MFNLLIMMMEILNDAASIGRVKAEEGKIRRVIIVFTNHYSIVN